MTYDMLCSENRTIEVCQLGYLTLIIISASIEGLVKSCAIAEPKQSAHTVKCQRAPHPADHPHQYFNLIQVKLLIS